MLICPRCTLSKANTQYAPDAKTRADKGAWCRSCRKEFNKEYNKLRKKEGKSSKGNFSYYGLVEADYLEMLELQNGGCAGCGTLPKIDKRLSIDHEHQKSDKRREGFERADRVRGLLCYLCNKCIGVIRDDIKTLRNLADYLENPPANKVVMPKFLKVMELLKEFEDKKK